MSFVYEERLSDSPFVEAIWQTHSDMNGSNIVIADGSWDIQIRREGTAAIAVICGPMSRAIPIPYTQGSECLGIRFKLGTFMPQLPLTAIRDITMPLPQATSRSFWLSDAAWQFPTYENVELFVEKLVRSGLLAHDGVVDAVLHEQQPYLSLRSVQRRFLRTTGLTHSAIRRIERARQAAALLEQGTAILDTAHRLGYADQPHLTRALKQLIGQTPAQIVRTGKP